MSQNENAAAVTQHLIAYYKLPVTKQTIEENVISHPDYPSLKSISDGLKEWKIKHYPLRLTREELIEADSPFIAHLNEGGGNLVFVPELDEKEKIIYFDSKGKSKNLSAEDFFERYSGVSLLIDPDENSGESDYKTKKQFSILEYSIPWIGLLAIVLFIGQSIMINSYHGLSISYFAILLTKLTGTFFSTLIVLKDLNIKINLTDSLCGVSEKTNCNSILNTAAAKIFGWLHWSDIGLIYFFSGFLMLISYPTKHYLSLLAFFSCVALFYVAYSIYYQAFVAKTWCRLCLIVQLVLIVEVFLFNSYWSHFELSWIPALNYAILALILLCTILIYKISFLNNKERRKDKIGFLKLKRNPNVFSALLLDGKCDSFKTAENVFQIGKPKGAIEISAFLSLNCNPCIRAFNQLKTLFGQEKIKINLVFSLNYNDRAFVNQVANLFYEKKHEDAVWLLDRWYNSNGHERKNLVDDAKKFNGDDRFSEIQAAHKDLFAIAKIKGTPTILINGCRLSREYQITDVPFFIDVL